MLSEILPRDRDCAFKPLTAVNIAPRMLMEGLALGSVRQVSDGICKRRAKSRRRGFPRVIKRLTRRGRAGGRKCPVPVRQELLPAGFARPAACGTVVACRLGLLS